ncbi:abietadiene synthase [Striga asiatica]|uniref:Abietadiene synthase n=1 Tax=Striga asiatica TaxID=4170 RepID=A0A5A7PRN2_STRAF|nr:abietadiene synthase [Striga asiatica]
MVTKVKKLCGIGPSNLLELRSIVTNLEPNEKGNGPSNELFLALSKVNFSNCVKLGRVPLKLLELKSKASRLTDMSSDRRFLLRSTIRQFPNDGGKEPEIEFDERLRVIKVVELISGMGPENV